MSELTTLLKKMKAICDSHNGEDTFKAPVLLDDVLLWEKNNGVKLSEELKEFYCFSNGMELRIYFSTFRICPIEELEFREGGVFGSGEYNGFTEIGDIVGDGSLICINRDYNIYTVYEGDDEPSEDSLIELIKEEIVFLEEKIENRDC